MTAPDKGQLLERMFSRLLEDTSDTASTRVLAEKSEKISRDVRSFNKAIAQSAAAVTGSSNGKRN